MSKSQKEFVTVMGHAKAALDMLSGFGIAPTLPRYTVAFLHETGEMLDLSAAVDALLARQQLDAPELDEIYVHFFGQLGAQAELRDASQRIENTITEVVGHLDVANGSVRHYGSVLADFSQTAKSKPPSVSVVANVLDETDAIAAINQELKARLDQSMQEMRLLREHVERLEREANFDALTGVGNRKYFESTLREAITQATTGTDPLCLLMIDIDRFKSFNDTHGHQMGDQVLKLVARYISECTRASDTVARYGGEEFENIRGHVASKQVINRRNGQRLGHITLSVGVAEYCGGESASELVRRADDALYAAKAQGRNRVVWDVTGDAAPHTPD
jgi:diguanylate cyclase